MEARKEGKEAWSQGGSGGGRERNVGSPKKAGKQAGRNESEELEAGWHQREV